MQIERAEKREGLEKGQVWCCQLSTISATENFPVASWRVAICRAGSGKTSVVVFTERKTPYSRSGGFEKAKEFFLQKVAEHNLQRIPQNAELSLGGAL